MKGIVSKSRALLANSKGYIEVWHGVESIVSVAPATLSLRAQSGKLAVEIVRYGNGCTNNNQP